MRIKILRAAFILALAITFSPASASAGCFEVFRRAMSTCGDLRTFIERSTCGADAGIELTGCVRRTVLGR
jgi:hypothetical protein